MQESSNLKLRPADAGDVSFLLKVFADTREAELAVLSEEQRSEFVEMQFRLRDQQYRGRYPSASDKLILLDERPIGRILVDRSSDAIVLVDVALLSEFRRRGIGTELIRNLIIEATIAGLPLQLQVFKFNRAVRLYQRLGFSVAGDDGVYLSMLYRTG